jgi:hypothetical protein
MTGHVNVFGGQGLVVKGRREIIRAVCRAVNDQEMMTFETTLVVEKECPL